MCTEGKNAATEIKCHSHIDLDDIVLIVTHPDSTPEVKDAYITFLTHCYIDTEVEIKEIYNSQHIYTLIEQSFCPDIEKQRNSTLVTLHNHLIRLFNVSWLTPVQCERIDRYIHIIALIADRRSLIHFLRSNHNSICETANHSHRSSRSATAERQHTSEYSNIGHGHSADVELKRVIDDFGGQNLRLKFLRRYFPDDAPYLKSLHQTLKEEDAIERLQVTQNELNKQGVNDLVVELFISHSSINILEESIHLAIALLGGGNTDVQKSIFRRLHECEVASEKCFQVFYDKMYTAQKILKSMSSMPNEITDAENDDFDDAMFASKYDYVPSIQSSAINDSPAAVVTSMTDNHTVDSPSLNIPLDSSMDTVNNITELESPQPLKATSIPYQPSFQLEIRKSSTPGTNDTFDMHSQNRRYKLPFEIRVMQLILHFLQLLCENHNPEFQNYLRIQDKHKTNYNLVCETLKFLDAVCGSQTGLLGLLGNYINEDKVDLTNQTLITLTEYCQGPCHDNQDAIVNHESNGIDIIIAIVLNDMTPLNQKIMIFRGKEQDVESREVETDETGREEEANDNANNVAQALARHICELRVLMRHRTLNDEALSYYHKHTAEIEIIRHDRSIEPIVFPVPQLCEFLTNEKKQKVFITCEQDQQGSKVKDFFEQFSEIFEELK
ncbi:unnamed protein product [Rotaria magnacalcarata]|uniref:RyR/IP3R Homology associated domain-containing protein n=3 Tax=Rotaria magnacalcarata TaxID=392030 RepID=A0A816XCE5_9BILA|nr:unnamed protein product [Rotaria magnacalcarata]